RWASASSKTGTMTAPPPTPKMPASNPASTPATPRLAASQRMSPRGIVSITAGSPVRGAGRVERGARASHSPAGNAGRAPRRPRASGSEPLGDRLQVQAQNMRLIRIEPASDLCHQRAEPEGDACTMPKTVLAPVPIVAAPIAGTDDVFPVRRVY